jgi:hypothetical protein
MKAGKHVIVVGMMIFIAHAGFSQNRDEAVFPQERTEQVKSIQLYPNPATEILNVKFEMPLAKRVRLTVNNIIGNVLEVETEVIDEYELQLKVRDLPSGFYLLSFRDNETGLKSTLKFLKR